MEFRDINKTIEGVKTHARCYKTFIRHHFEYYAPAADYFRNARLVCDLGSGKGASTLFIAELCPEAEIVTVDPNERLLPEVLMQLKERHRAHYLLPAHKFLGISPDQFDVLILSKAPGLIVYPEDFIDLSKHTASGGFVLELSDDEKLPEIMHNYFDSVSIYPPSISEYLLTDILWRKKS